MIELLVVIAIVAMLIGLLLPALGAARDSARGVVCSSRMRQLAIGWQIYADDNADVSVPGQPGRFANEDLNLYQLGGGMHYRPRWFAVIGAAAGFDAYSTPSPLRDDEHALAVDGSEVFLCPSADEWVSTRNYAYGYNYQFLGNTRFRAIDGGGNPEAPDFVNFPVRASNIQASGTVLAADAMGTAAGKPAVERTPNRVDGSRDPALRALGGHGYALDPPRLAASNADYADPRHRSDEHRSAPHARHGGRANVSFADGHVASLSLIEMGYLERADGSVAARGDDTTNRLFSGTLLDELAPGI